jgi:hypothetical protein
MSHCCFSSFVSGQSIAARSAQRRTLCLQPCRDAAAAQWLIIHGRLLPEGRFSPSGCVPPLAPANARRELPQQPHPDGWLAAAPFDSRGSCAARSLVACALRCAVAINASAGALIIRDAAAPQSGQCSGASRAATLRITANGPQCVH